MTAPTAVHATLPRRMASTVVRDARWRHAIGLVLALSRKNVKIRYKRTSMGLLWAVGQPLLQAVVLTFVFTRVFQGQRPADFGLYILTGVMPYSAISLGIQAATTSVVENASLVKKVMLPRIVFPLAAVGGTLSIFGASLLVLLAVSTAYGHITLATLALLPLAVAAMLLLILSVGIGTSALYVQYRDVRFVLESALLMLFYASPVFYETKLLGSVASWQRLNPVTGVLSLLRGALADRAVDWVAVGWTAGFGAIVLVVALRVFSRRAQLFADLT